MNVAMPQVILNCHGVMPFTCQVIHGGMAEHMGMHRKIKPDSFPNPRHQLSHRMIGQGATSLRDKQIGGIGEAPLQLAQRSQFGAGNALGAGLAIFEATDVELPFFEVYLAPAQGDRLGHL